MVVVGPTKGKDFNVEYTYVRVLIDSSIPLLMGFYVVLDNGRIIWVECRPKRVFRVCKNCGRISHIKRDCKWSENRVKLEQLIQRQELSQRHGLGSAFDPTKTYFGSDKLFIEGHNGRKTTSVIAHVHPYGTKYVYLDHEPIKVLTILLRFGLPLDPLKDSSSSSDSSESEEEIDSMDLNRAEEIAVELENEVEPILNAPSPANAHNDGGMEGNMQTNGFGPESDNEVNYFLIMEECGHKDTLFDPPDH